MGEPLQGSGEKCLAACCPQQITLPVLGSGEVYPGSNCEFTHDPKEKDRSLIKRDCAAWMGEQCKTHPCKFMHDPAQKGKGSGGGNAGGPKKKPICYKFQKGKCTRNDCKFSHEIKQRATPVENAEQHAPAAEPQAQAPPNQEPNAIILVLEENAEEPRLVWRRRLVVDEGKASADQDQALETEEPRFFYQNCKEETVLQRPSHLESSLVARRRVAPKDQLYDFETSAQIACILAS